MSIIDEFIINNITYFIISIIGSVVGLAFSIMLKDKKTKTKTIQQPVKQNIQLVSKQESEVNEEVIMLARGWAKLMYNKPIEDLNPTEANKVYDYTIEDYTIKYPFKVREFIKNTNDNVFKHSDTNQ